MNPEDNFHMPYVLLIAVPVVVVAVLFFRHQIVHLFSILATL